MKYYIYGLKCPIQNEIKYVGVTADITRRYMEHISRIEDTDKFKWVQMLKSRGMKPYFIVFDHSDNEEFAYKLEAVYVSFQRKIGASLFNVLEGGKIPPTNKGNKCTDDHKAFLVQCSPRKKRVGQFDKQGNLIAEFIGVREAGRKTGIDHRSISQVAAGSAIRKSAGGFNWKYV